MPIMHRANSCGVVDNKEIFLFRTSKAKIINNGSSDEFGICEKP
jgi:hypothetical protein